MGNSLQEQLLKSGLASAKQAGRAKKEQHKRRRQGGKGASAVPGSQETKQAQRERTERDRDLNRQREDKARERAIAAQVRQLIESHRIENREGEVAYNFTDDGKVKRIHVDAALQRQLGNGRVAIVRLGEGYELVPAVVAEKIGRRDTASVVLLNRPDNESDEEDPYAGYEVPDDLIW